MLKTPFLLGKKILHVSYTLVCAGVWSRSSRIRTINTVSFKECLVFQIGRVGAWIVEIEANSFIRWLLGAFGLKCIHIRWSHTRANGILLRVTGDLASRAERFSPIRTLSTGWHLAIAHLLCAGDDLKQSQGESSQWENELEASILD